jgi:hypothetical protein
MFVATETAPSACRTVAEVEAAVGAMAREFEPALYSRAQLELVLLRAAKAAKMLDLITSMTAAHLAATGPQRTSRQVVRDLAKVSGTSLRDAGQAMGAARALAELPDLAGPAREGRLSGAQLALVAQGASADPGLASELVKFAEKSSVRELADEVARICCAGVDAEERRKAVHAARALRQHTGADGAWYMHAKGTVEDGAKVMAAIGSFADKAFDQARREGRREASEAYSFDGLVGLATSGGAAAPSTEVVVRVDHSALMRGYAITGETCEVAGFGPTSVQAVYDLMSTGDPFLKAVVTKGKDVVGVAHMGRRPNAYQQTALDWLFPTCAVEGCGIKASSLQTDHREDWARTHFTVFDLLDRLCPEHHGLKTYQSWALVEGSGKRAFVPPDDPSHPRHQTQVPAPATTLPPVSLPPVSPPLRSGPPRSAANSGAVDLSVAGGHGRAGPSAGAPSTSADSAAGADVAELRLGTGPEGRGPAT